MADEFPVREIATPEHRHARQPGERRMHHVIVGAAADDTRIREETGNHGILVVASGRRWREHCIVAAVFEPVESGGRRRVGKAGGQPLEGGLRAEVGIEQQWPVGAVAETRNPAVAVRDAPDRNAALQLARHHVPVTPSHFFDLCRSASPGSTSNAPPMRSATHRAPRSSSGPAQPPCEMPRGSPPRPGGRIMMCIWKPMPSSGTPRRLKSSAIASMRSSSCVPLAPEMS